MTAKVLEARRKLSLDVYKVYRKYQDLVETVKEDLMAAVRVARNAMIKDGEILDGLNILYHHLKDHRFWIGEDTYRCCEILHRVTK